MEGALAKAQELYEHGKAAGEEAYAFSKEKANAALEKAKTVYAACETAYHEAQAAFNR